MELSETSDQPGLQWTEKEKIKLEGEVKTNFFSEGLYARVLDLIPRKWLEDAKGIININLFLTLKK